MKKIITALALAAITTTAQADLLLGGDVEVNLWQQSSSLNSKNTSNDEMTFFIKASLEHGIPLIPNVKLGMSSVDNDSLKYAKRDYTAYYEILDLDLVSVDAGLGVSAIENGEVRTQSAVSDTFSGVIPHAYAAIEVGIPTTPIFLFAEGYSMKFDDNSGYDISAGAQYAIGLGAVDLEIQAGYRTQMMEVSDLGDLSTAFESDNSGFFAGVNLDF